MEPVQGTRISKNSKKSVLALQDSRDQEISSPGTLWNLWYWLQTEQEVSELGGGEETLNKNEQNRAVHKQPSRGLYGWRNQAEVVDKSSKIKIKKK